NDPMGLVNTGLTVNEGATATLTSAQLQADVDDTALSVTYTVETTPGFGTLQLTGVTLNAGDTFTQDDINTGQVTYIDNGTSAGTDSFAFSISDGDLGTVGTTTFTITVNDPMGLVNTGLT